MHAQKKGDGSLYWTEHGRTQAEGAKKDSRPPSGMTLFEVLLVMALLVIIAGVVTPVISNSMSLARLENAGEIVRAAWGKARLAAMQNGEPYVFRYEQNGSRYQIVLLSAISGEAAGDVNSLPSESEADAEYAEADMLRLQKSRLPTEIVFRAGQVAAVPQMASAAQAKNGSEKSGWSQPIMFYADGTTSDAVVLIANANDETLRVTLRGLTGISRTSEVGHEESL